MNRRNFLGLMIGGVAVSAARTFPFRVFSFPKEVKLDSWQYYPPRAWPEMFGGEPSFVDLDRTVGPLSLYGLPCYIGDEDRPITTGVFYGIRRSEVVVHATAAVLQEKICDIKTLDEYSNTIIYLTSSANESGSVLTI